MSGKPFRPHIPGNTQLLTGIYRQLVDEWTRECDLPVTRHLRRWARGHRCLRGLGDLPGLLDRVDAADAAGTDEILLALISLAQQDSSQLAGRVLLQVMLPKLCRIASHSTPRSSDEQTLEDRRQVGIAAFYEVVHAYPIDRRRQKVAANLALDTLNSLMPSRARKVALEFVDPGDLEFIVDERSESETVPSTGLSDCLTADGQLGADRALADDRAGFDVDSGILEVIAWALETAVLTSAEASLLARVYAAPAESSTRQVAEDLGISYAAVRQRCTRATRKLIPAARAYVEGALIGDCPQALVGAS